MSSIGEIKEPNYISTDVVAKESGATYRQLDYWVREGLISPVKQKGGIGYPRGWDRDQIPEIAFLRRVQSAFSSSKMPMEILKRFLVAYRAGYNYLPLEGGFLITWTREEI